MEAGVDGHGPRHGDIAARRRRGMTRIGSSSRRRPTRRLATFVGALAILVTDVPVAVGARAGGRLLRSEAEPRRHRADRGSSAAGARDDADLIGSLIEEPQAVWFTQGTPAVVERAVRATVKRATGKGEVPVLVAYNGIPFRDCAQFSAGAPRAPRIRRLDRGLRRGHGDAGGRHPRTRRARDHPVVQPVRGPRHWVTNPNYEWCQPAEADPATAVSSASRC